MSEGGSQHNEELILSLLFRDQEYGFLVDVGAADGFWNSNSLMLLRCPEWKGILIEPEPSQFQLLQDRYRDRHGVQCFRCAIGKKVGEQTIYCGGQVSTFNEEVKRSAEVNHGVKYTTAQVPMTGLTALLKGAGAPPQIDFMSIDVEGMQYEVWRTLDTSQFSPKLVCMEGRGYRMNGYQEMCRTGCNTFYLREDICETL